MHWSWRSSFLLLAAPVIVGAAVLAAQNVNDLPAAPSEVNRPKPVPPKPAPPQPSPNQAPPASGSQPAPATAPGPQASTGDTQPSVTDEGVVEEGGTTIRTIVNEVSVVSTVMDKHNHYVKTLT